MSLRPPDFDRLLVPGTRVDTSTGWATVTDPLRVDVDLPSGEVVASAWDWEPIGFTATAPAGRYPVLLYGGVFDGCRPDRPTSAAVKLIIRDEPVASWSLALWPDQDAAELSGDDFFGFPVDGGEASLIDAQYLRELDETGTLVEFIENAYVALDRGGLLAATRDEAGRTAVMFKTGGGDGCYPTWVGRTADGALACYVIDFLILEECPT
jgi:hypothetical protein